MVIYANTATLALIKMSSRSMVWHRLNTTSCGLERTASLEKNKTRSSQTLRFNTILHYHVDAIYACAPLPHIKPLRTLLPILVLMIPQTKPPPSPRLTPAHILPKHNPIPSTLPHARRAKSAIAAHTLVVTNSRLQNLPTAFAAFGRIPAARPPRHERVPTETLRPGPFEFDHELAEKFGVPLVFVRFEQLVGLLVGEEVEDERAQGRRGADLLVEDARVAGRGDGIGRFAEARDAAQDVVAQRRGEQAVAKTVQIDEQEVFGAAGVVSQITV